jgi:hypothetical protein
MLKKFSISLLVLLVATAGHAQKEGELQPFIFKTKHLIETLNYLGTPLLSPDKEIITIAENNSDEESIELIEKALEKYTLFHVDINPESRVKVKQAIVKPVLQQNGWCTFLIKVNNEAGVTSLLNVISDQAKRDYDGGERINGFGKNEGSPPVTKKDIADRWLDLSLYTASPMQAELSGLSTEYFIVQLYSRDAGKRAARFNINCGLATQDIGFRNETSILFDCLPSSKIKLQVFDENNKPTTASLIIKDKQQHIYPSQAKRLAPDFFFQPQVYRSDNEAVDLCPGDYTIEYGRGPEYLPGQMPFTVTGDGKQVLSIHLQRWIDPSKYHWYSGDHHIHAAGCSHYTTPTEGVDPVDMMQHIKGEGVNVGSVLTWGPGYYHQKQFFEGKDNKLSTAENLLRYDLEISGFPSSHAGHLVLLRLKNQDYPNSKVLEEWPTWTIPILRWAKAQGAITGYAHSGLGLEVKNDSLPNYKMPRFDGIGANEYIVAVTQNLVDFISTMDTPPTWELNIWYHTLNCGYRTRISGETDFPCLSDERVAHGRSYVKIDSALNFDDWAEGLKLGRTYTSEGKSHILDFKVNDVELGRNTDLNLAGQSTVTVTAKVAAYLDESIDSTVKKLDVSKNIWDQRPFWNIERARIGNTRNVPVELVVNGKPVETKYILADGNITDISFKTTVSQSSWMALRILPSSHTNPIFVLVNNQPIRASKKSAEWCLKAVDQCWSQKAQGFSAGDKADAMQVYESAKTAYRKILEETVSAE